MKTYIINETSTTFVLKEGNAGAFRKLGELKGKDDAKRSKFTIKVDPNATYREYMVATGKKGKTIIITSDDFSGYEEIRIIKVDSEAGTAAVYKSVPTKPRKKNISGGCPVADEDESSPVESSSGAVPAEPILVPVPSTELGESSSGVSLAAIESNPTGNASNAGPNYAIPGGSPNAGPGHAVSGVSSNTVAVEAPTGGSHLPSGPAAGGSNHVPWYKRLLKLVR